MTDANYVFYKENPGDTVWWVEHVGFVGELLISFDKKHMFNLFLDYPEKLTAKQRAQFDKENPYWAEFLAAR